MDVVTGFYTFPGPEGPPGSLSRSWNLYFGSLGPERAIEIKAGPFKTMTDFPKPRIIVSKCLGFEAVRYNEQILRDELVEELREHAELRPVCPEMGIGLGTPRFPVRLVRKKEQDELVQPSTGKTLTGDMQAYSKELLEDQDQVEGFILKSRSPTCGIKDVKVYDENGVPSGKQAGLFGQEVLDRFEHAAIEDEGRLKNLKIREHFLTKVFALARLREVGRSGEAKDLVAFHSRHKYQLMAYSQNGLQKLGRIVADQKKLGFEKAFEQYRTLFCKTMDQPPKKPSIINTLTHLYGYFKKQLSADERKFFMDSMSLYEENRIPLYSLTTLLRSWALRFEEAYLLDQTFFYPFPSELANLRESGKELDL